MSLCVSESKGQVLSDSVLNALLRQAILDKNAKEISVYFHPKIDLVLLDNRGIYSKSQSAFLLASFFDENVPELFELVSERVTGNSNFVICKLHTANNHFRVCYLIKEEKDQKTIYQFRIEE
jgi:hypothetical protein